MEEKVTTKDIGETTFRFPKESQYFGEIIQELTNEYDVVTVENYPTYYQITVKD